MADYGVSAIDRPIDKFPEDPPPPKDFADWVIEGQDRGWIRLACSTHDGPIITPEADAEFEEGFDPCVPILAITVDTQKASL